MKARPILFSAPMIRALLDGRKSQSRRIVKPQPVLMDSGTWFPGPPGSKRNALHYANEAHLRRGLPIDFCRYGVGGDLIWVREACCTDWADKPVYKADDPTGRAAREAGYKREPKYRPSIHMPRWASRLTLELTEVRVQRLHEIRPTEIIEEGAVAGPFVDQFGRNPLSAFDGKVYLDLRSLWAAGWDSINGAGSWAANPWCWALSFRTHKVNVDEFLKQGEPA